MSKVIHNILNINNFSKILLLWNDTQNKRKMPWKGENDPYRIWISEIILQQTRVEQGLDYYNRFIKKYPTIKDLALANENEVFKLWEGLGYYSRCRNLIATAKCIHEDKNDIFPNHYEEIIKLKGIGPYTAAAIASFAFNAPCAVVDGNVHRVLSRVFYITDPIDSSEGKKTFEKLANTLLNIQKPGDHNQAIMDFGATVCKPTNPVCDTCIFNKFCKAYLTNNIEKLPVKKKRILKTHRYFNFFILEHRKKIAIKQRTKNDIWRHLFEFPMIETSRKYSSQEITDTLVQNDWIPRNIRLQKIEKEFNQILTHQTIHAVFFKAIVPLQSNASNDYIWITRKDLKTFAFPKIINSFLQEYINPISTKSPL
ncbi:MAG TPA: A/G-specific adenine glycosylase [Niabella sp.]|nr:A/G-specific adenine glycosylase [Niabella sp.]HOZ97968.1 A/G-specific adenine glycosylase [Niabella sp.]HQW14147.1 A/G-specific adenine glycosylase [Niabella sp.]HQX19546.1 A/G-specific adenine glycosylase [Niabella sp.]HRB08027.1 A/G-specific adenine glycosylase [Niabella sp.]